MPPKWRTRRNPIWRNLLIVAVLGGAAFGFWKYVLPQITDGARLLEASEDAEFFLNKHAVIERNVGKAIDAEVLTHSFTTENGEDVGTLTFAVMGEIGKGTVQVTVKRDEEVATKWKVIAGSLTLDGQTSSINFFD